MTNELATANTNPTDAMGMTMYSSIQADTQGERLAIFAAVADAEPLGDMVGEVILAENIILQPIQITDMNTDEQVDTVRCVIVDPDGKAYASIGAGIRTSIKNLMGIVGEPPYAPAIPLKVGQASTRGGYKTNTLSWVPDFKPSKK